MSIENPAAETHETGAVMEAQVNELAVQIAMSPLEDLLTESDLAPLNTWQENLMTAVEDLEEGGIRG